MEFATGPFVRRCPTGRSVALPCRVPGCRSPEVLSAHWDPILWRLCESCEKRAQMYLTVEPGLTWNELTKALAAPRTA